MDLCLSVVIPVGAGRPGNLSNALAALYAQTLPLNQFEVIIVDDGSGDNLWEVANGFPELDLRYFKTPKYVPGRDLHPRNKGARLARYEHLVFVDSDVILDREALRYYAEGFTADPHGAICGLYDWLPPARITQKLISKGLESIYHLVDVTQPDGSVDKQVAMRIAIHDWPKGKPTHNVCRDMRLPLFESDPPEQVYSGLAFPEVYLSMFSGNIGFHAEEFWWNRQPNRLGISGYSNTLTAGLVDDGALGMRWWLGSASNREYCVRLDQRIRGAHQYHDRRLDWVESQSAIEIKLIDEELGLRPGTTAEHSERVLRAWGADKWQAFSRQAESA